jgi:hypothetical protein
LTRLQRRTEMTKEKISLLLLLCMTVSAEIENQEFNRKEALAAEIKAYQEDLEREANNTTLARFIRNLESRIYAQLSRQLVDNLFGETPSESGKIELEGNTVEYETDGDFITLTITDAEGNETIITLPIGSFTF